jgi:hypothetical protein
MLSISYHFSIYFSSIFSISFHYSTHFSSIFFISFHKFLLYFQNLFTIQLTYLSYFPNHFTIQFIFLPYFPMFSSYQKQALTVMIYPLCTNCHDIAVILLNVALRTNNLTLYLHRHIPTYLSIYFFITIIDFIQFF